MHKDILAKGLALIIIIMLRVISAAKGLTKTSNPMVFLKKFIYNMFHDTFAISIEIASYILPGRALCSIDGKHESLQMTLLV